MKPARIAAVFVLLGLFVITTLSVIGANIGCFGEAASKSEFAKWGISGVVAEVVALCWFAVKFLFREEQLSLLLCPPPGVATLSLIDWDEDECFITGPTLKEKIKLLATKGPTLKVHFSTRILDSLRQEEFLELKLKDKNGTRWEVKKFYFFENYQTVIPVSNQPNPTVLNQVDAYE